MQLKTLLLVFIFYSVSTLRGSDLTKWNQVHVRYAYSMISAMSGDFGYINKELATSQSYLTSVDVEFSRFIKTNQAVYLEHLLNYSSEKGGRIDWSKTVIGFKYYPIAGGTNVEYKDKFNAINLNPSLSMYLGAEAGYGRILKLIITVYDESADSVIFGGFAGVEKSFGTYGLSLKGTGSYTFSFSKFPLSAIAINVIMGMYYSF